MTNFKTLLRKWLGFNDLQSQIQSLKHENLKLKKQLEKHVENAVDLHYKGNTKIIVTSRLNGGTVYISECQIKDIRDLQNRLVNLFGPIWPDGIIDAPNGIKRQIQREWGYSQFDNKGNRKFEI